MKASRPLIGLMPVLIVMAVVLWLTWNGSSRKSLVDRAHRECSACGLKDSEINGLIDAMTATSADRAELVGRSSQTYMARRPEPVCAPCIYAMIDAALAETDNPSPHLKAEREDNQSGTAEERVAARERIRRAVRMSQEHGVYMRYVPHSVPAAILVIVHGTIGQHEPAIEVAKRFIERWTEVAERHKLVLLAPAFDQENFGGHAGPGGGYRGLFGRHVGADEFIDAIVDAARQDFPSLSDRFYLYGHSAGGQLVSRYLVRHPQRIRAAVISSAGTFAFPDPTVCWTNGMKPLRRQMRWKDDDPWQQIDIKPDPAGWVKAAQLPITVVVGALETDKVMAIPGNPGETCIERGRLWVEAMNALARHHGATGNVRFVKVEGVGHNSAQLTPACQRALWPE